MSGQGLSPGAARLLEVLAAAGVPVTPAGLAAETGLASRTVSKGLGELRAAGLVAGSKSAPGLSLAGRAAAARRFPAPAGSWDARVGELLPVWHAAAVRLMADAVVARAVGPAGGGLAGFVIYGPPATFKSTLAELVVAMFGLDRASTIVANASGLSPGAVIGRRERVEGGWRFVRSGYVGQRFVCFDELADADSAVVREVTQLLYGERVVVVEGERVSVAPVTVACFNPPAGRRVLTEGTWRRVLRLDTATVAAAIPAGLGRRVGALLAAPPAPVELARLSWPALELPDRLRSVWDDVEAVLSDQGRAWHDARVFDTLVLGRAARCGHDAGEMDADSFAVALDVLCLAETVEGLVAHPDWRVEVDTLRGRLGGLPGGPEALAAVAARDAARVELDRLARQGRGAGEQLSVELVGARAELGERLTGAAKAITHGLVEAERPEGARLRAQLRDLARRAAEGLAERAGRLLAERGSDLMTCNGVDLAAIAQHFPASRSTRAALRAALARAWDALGRDDPPDLRAVRLPPQPRRRSKALDVDVAQAVEQAAWAQRDQPMGLAVLTGLYAGLRRAEIASLRWEHIELDSVTPEMWVRGKGGLEAAVPIHPILAEALAGHRRSTGWVFPARTGRDGHINPTTIWLWTKQVTAAAGIDPAKVRTHLLRHTMLTEANDRSGDLRTTQEIARHSRPETTAGYTRVERTKMHTVVAQVSYGRALPGRCAPDPADAIPGFNYRGVVEAIEAEDAPAWIDLGVTLTAAGWHPQLVHDGLGPSLWWSHPDNDQLIATASIDHRDATRSYCLDRLDGDQSDHWDFTDPAALAAAATAVAAGVEVAGSARYGPWIEQPFVEFLRGERTDGPRRPDRTPSWLHLVAD